MRHLIPFPALTRWSQQQASVRIVLLALLLLAFYLRIHDLTIAPPGLHYDEAAHGLDALRVWQGHFKIFFPTANGHEPLFTYLVALFVGFLENTVLAIRLPAAFCGTLGVAACYALGKRLLGPWQGLLGSALVAVTFWTVSLSRMGLRANTLLVLFPLWLLTFWACRQCQDWRRYLLAGVMLGAAQYTYTAARFMPLLALILVIDWRKTLSKRGLLLGAGAAALVTTPLLLALLLDPAVATLRLQQVWLFNRAEPLALLWRQLQAHLLMFGMTGDPIWIHNLPGRPPVLPLVAIFFWIGVVVGWRSPALRTLSLAVAVMLGPGILAVSNVPVPPDHLRVIAVAPVAFLLVAAALQVLSQSQQRLAIVLACALVLLDGGLSWRDYGRWQRARESYEQLDAAMSVLAQEIRQQPDTFFLIPISAAWQEFEPGHHWTIDYLTGFQSNYYVVSTPYVLPALSAEQVILVRWLAGMHQKADPQRALAGELRLLGYAEQEGDQRPTYAITRFVRSDDRVAVVRLGQTLHFEEEFTITNVIFYRHLIAATQERQLMAEVRWESQGPHAEALSLSLRVASTDGGGAAQVDSWLWNDRGETAEKWQAQEESRLFLELDASALPPGVYQVTLLPYRTATLAPLQAQDPATEPELRLITLP